MKEWEEHYGVINVCIFSINRIRIYLISRRQEQVAVINVDLMVGKSFFSEIAYRLNSPGEIVMVILRPEDKVLLMTKKFYPESLYRLPTGKMKPGESIENAFQREIREETGFCDIPGTLLTTIHYMLKNNSSVVDYKSFLMITSEISDIPIPEDEDEGITDFKEVHVSHLKDISEKLKNLSAPWHDWGCFRAVSHEIAYHLLMKKKREG